MRYYRLEQSPRICILAAIEKMSSCIEVTHYTVFEHQTVPVRKPRIVMF